MSYIKIEKKSTVLYGQIIYSGFKAIKEKKEKRKKRSLTVKIKMNTSLYARTAKLYKYNNSIATGDIAF